MKIYYNILIVILILISVCVLNYILDDCNCTECKEGFKISGEKLISNSLTTKQCQDYCINQGNCRYTNRIKRLDKGERQKCWISSGFGQQKILPGDTYKETWENKKYKPRYLVKAKNIGTNQYSGGGWDPNVLKRSSCRNVWSGWIRNKFRKRCWRSRWKRVLRGAWRRHGWWPYFRYYKRWWSWRPIYSCESCSTLARRLGNYHCVNYNNRYCTCKKRTRVCNNKGNCSGNNVKNCYRKLRKGEGDCDRDSDCQGRLRCFQRNRNESVPGINMSGFPSGYDICYDPNDRKYQ